MAVCSDIDPSPSLAGLHHLRIAVLLRFILEARRHRDGSTALTDAIGSSLNRSRATPCLGRAGFLRGRDGVLLMNHLEDLLVDLFRSQHV